jgi:hypothetical protein
MWPIGYLFYQPMLDGIVMDIRYMSRKIIIVTDQVLSIPPLPDAALSFG